MPENRLLFLGLDSVGSGLSDVSDRFGHRHTLRHPICGSGGPRPTGATLTVNDYLGPGRQAGDQAHELLKLVDCRGMEILHRQGIQIVSTVPGMYSVKISMETV